MNYFSGLENMIDRERVIADDGRKCIKIKFKIQALNQSIIKNKHTFIMFIFSNGDLTRVIYDKINSKMHDTHAKPYIIDGNTS